MERIQEAIAKARNERLEQSSATPQGQGTGQPVPLARSGDAETSDAKSGASPASVPLPQHADPDSPPDPVAAPPARPADEGPETEIDIAARWTALPALTPSEARLRRSHIVTYEAGRDANDFDVIRTRILQLQRTHGWTRIAITSPTASCGKTTLALNLAFSLARQPDKRTILYDFDFRRPALARLAGIGQKQAMSKVLEGRDAFEHNAVRVGTNLILATNAQPVRNPSEILQGDAAGRALDEIAARYRPTTMIFDLPPLLAGDDTMGFLANVDAAILVAAAETTTIKQIDACERDIASQTAVMGVILNKCRYIDRDTGYGQYGES